MTDDQRDALCNMGESLGLTGGQAEDLIDEYLEEVSAMPMQPSRLRQTLGRPSRCVRPGASAVPPSTVKLGPRDRPGFRAGKPPQRHRRKKEVPRQPSRRR